MRLLPNPWLGLHPAFADQPPPLAASNFTSATSVGASVGLYGVAVGAFFKGRPTLGLTAAAYTMALAGCGYAYVDYVQGETAKQFLDTKGIKVPKRKLVDRLGSFDQDNVILLGALAGIAVASRRIRPQHMSRFSWYGGAACFGTMGSSMALALVPWPARKAAQEQAMKNAMIAQQYQGELIAAIDPEAKTPWPSMSSPMAWPTSNQGGQVTINRADHDLSSVEDSDPVELPNRIRGYSKLDVDDPRPHLSEIQDDGERVFKPATNYDWAPKSYEEAQLCLNEHIQYLKKRREGFSQEAELIWHTIATREAEHYHTSWKAEQRIALETMNEIHVNIWLQISYLDWMIADSTKNLLQLKAELGKEKSHWIPPLPENADKIKPKLTRKFVAEMSDENRDTLAALKELPAPPPNTPRPVGAHRDEEVEKAVKAVESVQKILTMVENRQKALDAMLDDADRRIGR